MYTQGQEFQTTGTTSNYTTQQYQYEYQYQLPTTTQTTTTTTQYTTQPVTYSTQQYSIPEYTQSYTQENYTVSGVQSVPGVVTSVQTIPGVVSGVQTVPNVVTSVQTIPGVAGPIKPQPAFRLLRQGSGISPHEQQAIVNTSMLVYQYGITPTSNNTASRIKKTLGGDWIVIVYPQGKPVDFNMTCVQGNDYMYFTLDNWAYQVCRLR